MMTCSGSAAAPGCVAPEGDASRALSMFRRTPSISAGCNVPAGTVRGAPDSARNVAWSATPVGRRLRDTWNDFSAASVLGPNSHSDREAEVCELGLQLLHLGADRGHLQRGDDEILRNGPGRRSIQSNRSVKLHHALEDRHGAALLVDGARTELTIGD